MSSVTTRLTGNLPSEWAAIPPEIMRLMIPITERRLTTPTGDVRVVNHEGVLTPQQKKALDEILKGRWFLIRNGGVLDPARCGRCRRKHKYLTLGCIEKPYDGLGEIVAFMERQRVIGTIRRRVGRQIVEEHKTETVLSAVEYGPIEPITPQQAAHLIDRINAKGLMWQGRYPDLAATG